MKARDNPFRSERVLTVRYRPLEGSMEELLARLAGLDYRAEIVGPQGSGKTTLLEDLGELLAGRGIPTRSLRLDGRRRPAPDVEELLGVVSPDEIVVLDGSDCLGFLAWRRLERRSREARGLVVTTHRGGRLPTLLRCETTPELLCDIVRNLRSDDFDALETLSRRLFEQHRGNLRDALRALYDVYAGR